ncbi:MAG: methyltransferase domain-containing protein, partial [Pyrinomonadaceae bacterium]|nr:methyltransferase domain-containing protein [Pyrinomonadaceae bacterium]
MKKTFAKKSFGQNFLVDGNYINKIIAALDLQAGETVIEIGSGRGALTEGFIESGANVIAIELERDMNAVLRGRFGDRENFQLIEADALKIDYSTLRTTAVFSRSAGSLPASEETAAGKLPALRLVANLPYYISTAILQKLIEQRDCFSEMILMFQLEVVERITAEIG